MRYCDQIFGSVNINDKLVLELIDLPVFQRLKGIDQSGHPACWTYHGLNIPTSDYNRFDHSVGVYLLLNRFHAPYLEQIAGLLHDVSHTAFSHCADYIFAGGSAHRQDFQDNRHKEFICATEIPGILKKYGLDFAYILNDNNFPLKEKPLPDLCADRIEYSLRTALVTNSMSCQNIKLLLNRLLIIDKQWVFSNSDAAEEFAGMFMLMNRRYYSGHQTAIMFKTVSDYLKHALNRSYVNPSDFDRTDAEVLDKISVHLKKDSELNKLKDRIEGKTVHLAGQEEGEKIIIKSRVVDPLCRHKSKIMRLSEIKSSWKKILKTELQPKAYYLNFDV